MTKQTPKIDLPPNIEREEYFKSQLREQHSSYPNDDITDISDGVDPRTIDKEHLKRIIHARNEGPDAWTEISRAAGVVAVSVEDQSTGSSSIEVQHQ